MTEWDNIRKGIRRAETPLSEGAWKDMENMLESSQPKNQKRRFGILFWTPLILGLGWILTMNISDVPKDRRIQNETDQDLLQRTTDDNEIEYNQSKDILQPPSREMRSIENVSTNKDHLVNSGRKIESADQIIGVQEKEPYSIKENGPISPRPIGGILELPFQSPTLSTGFQLNLPIILSRSSDDLIEPSTSTKRGHWEIKGTVGLNTVSTAVSYQNDPMTTHKDFANLADGNIQRGLGYQAGVELSWFIRPNIKIASGFGLKTITTHNSIDFSVKDIPVIDSSSGNIIGYIPTNNPVQQKSNEINTYRFLRVPIGLFYSFPINEKWAITTEFNNSVNLLVGQNEERIEPSHLEIQTTSEDRFNPLVFQYQLRAGLRYQLDRRWSLAFEPSFQGQYNNTYRSDKIIWKPWSLAFDVGVIFRLD